MSATLDINVVVNLLSGAVQIDSAVFNEIALLSDDVTFGASPGDYKIIESAAAAATDAELGAGPKAKAATFFSQPLHPPTLTVVRATALYADVAGDLVAMLANRDSIYCVTLDDRTKANNLDVGAFALANERLAVLQSSDADLLAGTAGNVAETLQGLTNNRAAVLYHDVDAEGGDIAWAAQALAVDPDLASTTWAYKQLAGVSPTQGVDDTAKTAILDDGGNVYLPFKGVSAVFPGVAAAGAYLDTVVSKDWLKNRVAERIAQGLLDASARGKKIPYDDEGIGQIASFVQEVLDIGVAADPPHFLAGSTQVIIPKRSSIPDADVTARELKQLRAQATLAGSIETVTLNIAVLAA